MNNYLPHDEFYEDGFAGASERYRIEIDEILQVMDKPEIDVNDDTQFWDYYSVVSDAGFQDLKDIVYRLYKVEVNLEDYIWETAEKIHESQIS